MKRNWQTMLTIMVLMLTMVLTFFTGCTEIGLTEIESDTDLTNDDTNTAEDDSNNGDVEMPSNVETQQPEETTSEENTMGDESESNLETTEVCEHQYEFDCSAACMVCGEARIDVGAHTYDKDTKCEDVVCTNCGYVLSQQHDWQETTFGTATLLSAGTVVEKCSKCKQTNTIELDKPIEPSTLGMPIVYITDLDGAEIPLADLKKADGEIVVKYRYVSNDDKIADFESVTKIKIQGASSAEYPKKNFTVKFYTDDTLEKKLKVDLGWGKENKYCMKANYIDFSQARNVVAARMFSQVVVSRPNINEGLKDAPNYGLIDGYPVIVYLNGEFHGLYTMNIPKDSWQFAMEGDETTKEALLMADAWTDSVNLNEQIGEFVDGATWETYGWEVEHCSTKDETWIRDSFNKVIAILNCGDKDTIRKELPKHLDIEAAIDNMIFTYFINAADNRAKNILWATYDGEIWIPSMYDMDGTFGIYWNGQPIGTSKPDFPQNAVDTYPYITSDGRLKITGCKMYEVLCKCFSEEVEARYRELRKTVLNDSNTRAMFDKFFDQAHEIAYASDFERWNMPDMSTNIPYRYGKQNKDSMYKATHDQLARLDAFFYKFADYVK